MGHCHSRSVFSYMIVCDTSFTVPTGVKGEVERLHRADQVGCVLREEM